MLIFVTSFVGSDGFSFFALNSMRNVVRIFVELFWMCVLYEFFNGFFVLNLSSFWFACWIAWIHFAYFVRSGNYIAAPYVFFLWFVIFVAKIYNWAWITHYSVLSFDLCLFGTQLNLYLLHANGLIEDYDSCSQTQPIRVVFLKILSCDIDAA